MPSPHSVYRSSSTRRSDDHSTLSDSIQFDGFTVLPIAILDDNYSYLLIDDVTHDAAVIDPADPTAVHDAIEQFQKIYHSHDRSTNRTIHIKAVFTTHKHWDHASGNTQFISLFQSPDHPIAVYGHALDRIDACTHAFGHSDSQSNSQSDDESKDDSKNLNVQSSTHQVLESFTLGSLTVNALLTRCHTKGHTCYHIQSSNQSINQSAQSTTPKSCVFTGDTLFVCGCGKFFEGSPNDMYEALYSTLGALDDDVVVFGGHEYAIANLEFASWAEPDNQAIKNKLVWAKARRTIAPTRSSSSIPTSKSPISLAKQSINQSIPLSTLYSTMGEERQINPFLRCDQLTIRSKMRPWLNPGEMSDSVTTLGALRKAKDEQAHKKTTQQ